jgi:GalNAc-alpha-(1->4)-GalNAc-alpha-(1->3)-diNAcBac-PP-undecaprenol alpha-1,4-N-acetyl-D-galactosaminyltransferase
MGAARTPIHAVLNNVRRLRSLRYAIAGSRPDVAISFLDTMNVLTLLATRGAGVPVVVTEHTDPNLAKRHPVWSRLRTALYPRAARVVVLSESSKSFFPPRLRDRISIVPNPIVVSATQAVPVRDGRKRVAALGRFGPEKGFDTLISAYAAIAPDFPDWDLVIWGDGPLRADLERHIAELGMTGRVSLPGRTSTPHDALRSADLYALSSRREGFPMALAEGMACGLPAVAFNLPSGPRDIIRDGVDGVLVPNGDQDALSSAMADLMRDDKTRAAFAHRAPEVLERFGVERVMAIWDDLLAEAIPNR